VVKYEKLRFSVNIAGYIGNRVHHDPDLGSKALRPIIFQDYYVWSYRLT